MADGDGTTEVQPKGEPLAERVGAIEAEQQRQGGILERIERALAGQGKASPSSSSSSETESGTGRPSVAEQVRQGVAEIEAEKQRKAEAAAASDAAEARLKGIEDRLPERKPAEPATGRKAKLQAAMFGKPDPR